MNVNEIFDRWLQAAKADEKASKLYAEMLLSFVDEKQINLEEIASNTDLQNFLDFKFLFRSKDRKEDVFFAFAKLIEKHKEELEQIISKKGD